MINKVYIIGGARSGKSFLANKILEKTQIPHFDLDKVIFIKLGIEKRGEKERNLELEKILTEGKWIIEGAYNESWIQPALEKADLIIWLDTPIFTKFFRFLKRVFEEGLGGPGNIYGRGRLALGLKYKNWDRSKKRYSLILNHFKNKLTVISSKKDINKLLNKF